MIYILIKLLINPFKHYKSNCIKTYVKFQANQMKFNEFMESQIEPSFSEEFFWIKFSHQLLLEIEYKVMEAISYHEVNE